MKLWKNSKLSVVGVTECKLIFDQWDPMILYNASLTNINKHCLYTEKFNTINYRCLNYYNFLDEPIQKLKQETN